MKYYIIAGEASGDLHGGNLIRALLARQPQAEIRFWGGDHMAAAAGEVPTARVTQVRHIRDLAFMGFLEVVSHLSEVLGNIRMCKRDIEEFHPDVMVFIDYPGFNLKIAKYTHARGYKNVYYISPQIWAWKKNRIRPMRRDLDRLCYILPSEKKFYAENTFPQACYVGHPLLDEVARYRDRQQSPLSSDDTRPLIALLPGSRKQELKRMIPLMMRLVERHPEYRFAVAGMSLLGEDFYRALIPEGVTNVDILFDRTYDLLASAHAAVVCSGTATLETALFRLPQVVCYQCNRLSAGIARLLIGSRIKYISLVNLIADRPVVCELIQGDYNPDRLEREFHSITVDTTARETMQREYDRVIDLLGGPGASDRTVEEIMKISNNC